MLFKNLETGVEWEVTNPDRIAELEKSKAYEQTLIEAEKPIEKETEKPKTKKKETK